MRRSTLIRIAIAALIVGAVPSRMGADVIVAGVLVDSACYLSMGLKAVGPAHAKCAMACAQKGQRLALVTPTGDVYMVTGTYVQGGNAKLIPMLNAAVVVTGTVSVRTPGAAVPVLAPSDSRRPIPTPDTTVVTTIKTGDVREGDVPDGSELTIEITSIKLAVALP